MEVSSRFCGKDKISKKQYVCRTMRFEPDQHDVSPFGILISSQEPCVLLSITEQKISLTPADQLKSIYNLSQAETDIAHKIAEGLTLYDISDLRQVSVNTVRNQVQSIMHKMKVHKQLDMINLVREN